jgi:hypothetical protein
MAVRTLNGRITISARMSFKVPTNVVTKPQTGACSTYILIDEQETVFAIIYAYWMPLNTISSILPREMRKLSALLPGNKKMKLR